MVRGVDERCHLLYARWPRALGHAAWVTDSEIAYATAVDPLGPYEHQGIALAARGESFWDGRCTHNPTVACFDRRYYLYYMGTRGEPYPAGPENGLNWSYRNHQNIGVAVADHPAGPWQRSDEPLFAMNASVPGTSARHICCSNPTVAQRPDGKFLMIYKAVEDQHEPPFYGPVVHRVAIADEPTGPFVTLREKIFEANGVSFPAEDPVIWVEGHRWYAIVKDMGGYFTGRGKSMAGFTSDDGIVWKPADDPLVCVPEIHNEDGTTNTLSALERPQVYLENGKVRVLFCAAEPDASRTHSFNVHIPVG